MIPLTVNGKPEQVDAAPEMPLLWVLREILGLTGTKYGCGSAQCGACRSARTSSSARSMRMRTVLVVAALLAVAGRADADEALWTLLKGGGQVVMIRHAKTDGSVGDPPGFRLDDCATQRNLLEAGREDARRIGRTFAARGVPVELVLSSQWCRCLETARLAFGRVEAWRALQAAPRDTERLAEIRERVGGWRGPGTLVLVSHNITIRAATRENLIEGELLVLTPGGGSTFRVAGRVPPGMLDD